MDDIDAILRVGEEKTAELNKKYQNLGLDDLQKFTSEGSAYDWQGEDWSHKVGIRIGKMTWITETTSNSFICHTAKGRRSRLHLDSTSKKREKGKLRC